MLCKEDPEQTAVLLRAHHDEIIKPELVRRNCLRKGRDMIELPSLKDYASLIAEKKGGDRKEIMERLEVRDEHIGRREKRNRGLSPCNQRYQKTRFTGDWANSCKITTGPI